MLQQAVAQPSFVRKFPAEAAAVPFLAEALASARSAEPLLASDSDTGEAMAATSPGGFLGRGDGPEPTRVMVKWPQPRHPGFGGSLVEPSMFHTQRLRFHVLALRSIVCVPALAYIAIYGTLLCAVCLSADPLSAAATRVCVWCRLDAERRDKSMRSTLSKTSQIINKTAQSSLQSTLNAAFERWKSAATGWKGVGGACTTLGFVRVAGM